MRQRKLSRRQFLKFLGAAGVTAGAGAAGGTTAVRVLRRFQEQQSPTGFAAVDSGTCFVNEDFEDDDYTQWFNSAYDQGTHDRITDETAHEGRSSLRVDIPQGNHRGISADVDPQDAGLTDENIQELYASYWIKFGQNFQSDANGGKLPGPANRERTSGGGAGVPANGSNGWSVRGKFGADNDGIILGYYTYHIDMAGRYGDHLEADTRFPRGEWHLVEQYMKLNTVSGGSANRDGELKLWVNGKQHIDRTDMRWTLTPDRGINYKFLVYYGGSSPSPADNHLYFDNWQLAVPR